MPGSPLRAVRSDERDCETFQEARLLQRVSHDEGKQQKDKSAPAVSGREDRTEFEFRDQRQRAEQKDRRPVDRNEEPKQQDTGEDAQQLNGGCAQIRLDRQKTEAEDQQKSEYDNGIL